MFNAPKESLDLMMNDSENVEKRIGATVMEYNSEIVQIFVKSSLLNIFWELKMELFCALIKKLVNLLILVTNMELTKEAI
jgi:hypothetical protein